MEYHCNCQLFTYIVYTSVALISLKLFLVLTKGNFKNTKRLDGQVIIITGSSRGIGKCTALDLAMRGAKVIIASSNLESAIKTRGYSKFIKSTDEIIQISDNKNVKAHHLDLGSFKSIRKFANYIISSEKRLDVLINNAGVGLPVNKKSEDGLALELQINHYGHFLLTNLLIDLLKKSAPSRIIHVSSLLQLLGRLDFDNMNSEKIANGLLLYGNSKLYNILGSNEFARRLKGTGVVSNSLHPGTILTDIFDNVASYYKIIIFAVGRLFFKTPKEGAQTTIYLAVSDEVAETSGKYFMDCREMNIFNRKYSREQSEKFWDKCCDLVGLKPEERYI